MDAILRNKAMGQPPRLERISVPWERPVVYFLTLCIEKRRRVLDNCEAFTAIVQTCEELRRWTVISGVIMPDHLHFLITPRGERGLEVSDFLTGFKRVLRRQIERSSGSRQSWDWQRGSFDRLLRSEESAYEKWLYMRENPVRAGIVSSCEEWPFYIDYTGPR